MPIEYSKTVPFTGHASKALAVARSAFINLGFNIVTNTDYEIRVTGRGMTSTRENALKGVTEADIIIRPTTIEVKAVLGGAQKMKRFIRIFPLAMAVFFLIVFGVIAAIEPTFRIWWLFLMPVAVLAPWLVLAPLIGRSIENNTKQAVDTLVNNMIMLSSEF